MLKQEENSLILPSLLLCSHINEMFQLMLKPLRQIEFKLGSSLMKTTLFSELPNMHCASHFPNLALFNITLYTHV